MLKPILTILVYLILNILRIYLNKHFHYFIVSMEKNIVFIIINDTAKENIK